MSSRESAVSLALPSGDERLGTNTAVHCFCTGGKGKKASLLRMLDAQQGPTPADALWDMAKEHPDANLRSKTFMKQMLLQLKRDHFIKTVSLGDHFGYQLSDNFRQKLIKSAKAGLNEAS